MKTPAYLQQFINKAALPLWKSNLWLRSLSNDSCQIELRPFLREQVSTSLKPPPPLALIAISVGTLRKETGICLGRGNQIPSSLLKAVYLPLALPRQGESFNPHCLSDTQWMDLAPQHPGQGAPRKSHWHKLVKQQHSQERRKPVIRQSEFAPFLSFLF